jgi:hypothetical protein
LAPLRQEGAESADFDRLTYLKLLADQAKKLLGHGPDFGLRQPRLERGSLDKILFRHIAQRKFPPQKVVELFLE